MEYQLIGFGGLFIIFGILQGLLLSIVLISQKGKRGVSLLLGLLLFTEFVGLSEQFVISFDLIEKYPHVLMTSYPFEVLSPALIYLFTRSFLESKFQLKSRHLLHLIPFFLYILILLPEFQLSGEDKVLLSNRIESAVWSDSPLNIGYFVLHFSIHLAYIVLTLKVLMPYRKKILRSKKRAVKWIAGLITFLLAFILIKFALAMLFGARMIVYETVSVYAMLTSGLIVQCIAWMRLTSDKLPILKLSQEPSLYELKLLKDLMEEKKVYLEEDLSVGSIGQKMGVGPGRVAELFSYEYGKTFKETVGEYRIEEAKRIIEADMKNDKVNLLAIALDSGFNNKVSFYRMFKKVTGKAPSHYVDSLKKTN